MVTEPSSHTAGRRIVVAGSTTVDLLIGGIEQLPTWGGDEFRIDNLAWCREPLRMLVGGNGANTAFALGRLGADVRLFSGVGNDLLGDAMVRWLAGAGVELDLLRRRADAATSTTTMVSDAALNRLSFHHAGAYATTAAHELPAGWETGLGALVLTSYPLLTSLRGEGYAAMLRTARACGAITAIDIGPAIGQVATLAELAPLLPLVDCLIANEHEYTVFAGGTGAEQIRPALEAGAGAVVIKAGAHGARLATREREVRVPAFAVQVRQTVGAGDTFDAALVWAMLAGKSQQEAVRWANAAAACVVSAADGVLSAPDVRQVAALVESARQ